MTTPLSGFSSRVTSSGRPVTGQLVGIGNLGFICTHTALIVIVDAPSSSPVLSSSSVDPAASSSGFSSELTISSSWMPLSAISTRASLGRKRLANLISPIGTVTLTDLSESSFSTIICRLRALRGGGPGGWGGRGAPDRKSTRLNSSHVAISYAVFCLKKKTTHEQLTTP